LKTEKLTWNKNKRETYYRPEKNLREKQNYSSTEFKSSCSTKPGADPTKLLSTSIYAMLKFQPIRAAR